MVLDPVGLSWSPIWIPAPPQATFVYEWVPNCGCQGGIHIRDILFVIFASVVPKQPVCLFKIFIEFIG